MRARYDLMGGEERRGKGKGEVEAGGGEGRGGGRKREDGGDGKDC